MKKLIVPLLLSLFVAMSARAQTATVTPSPTSYSTSGGTITFTVNLSYSGTVSALGLTIGSVPTGWTFGAIGGTNQPENRPSSGFGGSFTFSYATIPTTKTPSFTFTVNYPASLTGNQTFGTINMTLTPSGGSPASVSISDVIITQTGSSGGSSGGTTTAPTITSQPASVTVNQGQVAAFGVVAGGNPAPSYQWQKNGSDIFGATSSTFGISSAQLFDAGNYTVVVSNSAGSVTSNIATLTVNVPPTISSQPTSTSANQGQSATFTVSASGTPVPTYQWRKNGNSITGATNSVLTLTGLTATDAASYDVVVTNAGGSVTSTAVTLTVVLLPTVVSAPSNVSVNAGGTANFSVTAGGTGPFTYQWRKNGASLSGQTASTLSLAGVTTADVGNYDVVISNSIGNVVSSFASLIVNTAPAISVAPNSVTTTQGQTVQFSVSVVSGSLPSFQWRKDTGGGPVNITNANNSVLLINGVYRSVLTLSSVTASDVATYDVVVTNSVSSATSPTATLTLVTVPSISVQPASQTGTTGGSASFSVTASGTAPLYYQWRKNGTAISGAVGATLNIVNISSTDAATYDVVVSNSYGTVTSSAATLSAPNVQPTITSQPSLQSAVVGGSASFSVTATGTPSPTYQWRRNGVAINPNSSATSATLTLSNIQASDAGNYDVIVGNSVGSIISSTATLTVNVPPSIVAQPISYTAVTSSNAYFVVTVSGTGPFTYNWRKNGVSLSGASNVNVINGTNTSQLTVFGVTSADNANYDVVVTSSYGGPVTSNGVATLFVVSSNFSPSITSGPLPQVSVTEGNSASFTVVAAGNPSPTYQWQKNGTNLTDGSNPSGTGLILGSTSATLTITQATYPADNGTYTCVATNSSGTATSSASTLTVNKSPTITSQPAASTTLTSGGSATLSVSVTANPTPAYQWFKDGFTVVGATSSSLALTSVTTANAGNYTVVATNSIGSVTSTTANVVVNQTPVITVQPVSASVAQNQSYTLSVAASGGPSLTYQWSKGGSPIGGATGATYTINSAQPTDAGNYTVAVTNAVAASATSNTAVVTVLAFPSISAQPSGGSFNQGQSLTLSVTAAGGAPLSYQWYKDGTAVSGATSASLALPSLTADQSGLYSVTVSNTVGSISSSGASVQVSGTPVITGQPLSQTVIVGSTVTFSVIATGSPGPSYQWSKNGQTIEGAVSSNYTIGSAQKSDAGLYRVSVSNSLGTVTSNVASLAVNDVPLAAPTITTQPANYTGTAGTGTTLSVAATGNPAPTYQWSKNGTAISGATNSSLVLTGLTSESGSYTVTVTNSVGSVTSNAATVLIKANVAAPVIAVQPQSRTLSVGASATLSVQATGQGTLIYQWFKGGTAISGATTSELALTNVSSTNAGVYSVTVTNDGGTATSANATVTVSSGNTAPTILVQPAPQVAGVGLSATFTVVAVGTPAPTYQWRKNGTNISGATSATLALSNVTSSDAGSYDVVVTNSVASVVSAVARLTVSGAPVAPTITRQPADVRVVAGRSATFTVVANGTPAPTYQWRLNGTAISGATSATLTLSGVTTAQAGAYSVVVSNSAGSVTSNNAGLTVLARSYAGSWFGTLGTGGTFALRLNDDNTGVFLGFLPSSKTSYTSRSVTINDDGSFRFAVTTTASAAALTGGDDTTDQATAAGVDDLTFAGNIASDGSLTASTTTGTTLALTAARSDDAGVSAVFAGFYATAASGSSAQTLLLVSPAGKAFALVQSGASVDGGTGTADATGRVTVTTAGALSVNAAIAADSGAISVTIVDSKNVATTYSGFASGSTSLGNQRLVNISTRTSAGIGDQSAIVGFVITGLESKTLLIRAVGPTLNSAFGLTTAMTAPRLDLLRGSTVLATNIGWTTSGNSAEIIAAAARSGAFPLGATSADSVILTTLPPGQYSAQCSAADAKTGVALVEVYDLSGGSTAQKLANISTRAVAGSGDNTLIAGVVVTGAAPKRVLIRAAGPALAQFGLTGFLATPRLTLFNGSTSVATNAGWSTSTDAAAITEAAVRAGAFPFPTGSADAALLVNLAPGAYTAQVTGVGSTSGITLVEIYELP